jgi:RNA polymerase sigma factor (TIGR02999 family)
MSETAAITRCLLAWQANPENHQLGDQLSRLTYHYLRQMASARLRGETDPALTPTELVHEAWLSLKPAGPDMTSRNQFFKLASTVMRNLLVDLARERRAAKRGGGWLRMTLSAADHERSFGSETLLDLDRALEQLAEQHPRHGEVVVLRCFGGLSLAEIATTLDISLATVKRDWVFACAWLADALRDEEQI